MATTPEKTSIDQFIALVNAFSDPYIAIIVVFLVILVIFLLAMFSPSLRDIIKNTRIHRKVGDHETTIEPASKSTQHGDELEKLETRAATPDTSPDEIEPNVADKHSGQLEVAIPNEDQLFNKMLVAAIFSHDISETRDAYETLKSLAGRKMSDEALESEKAGLELQLGVNSAEQDLIGLESANEDWIQPSLRLARYYISLASYDRVEKHLAVGLSRAKTPTDMVAVKKLHAENLYLQGHGNEAKAEIEKFIEDVEEIEHKTELLDQLATFHQKSGDSTLSTLCMERALLLEPSNKTRRFNLAFKYGANVDTTALAFYHYNILKKIDSRHTNVLNNLGVIYQHYDILGEMINCWRTSSLFDKPYPSANLAIRLISAGFFREARDYLDGLPPEKKLEPLPVRAATSLENKISGEEESIKQLHATALIHHDVISDALVSSDDDTLSSSDNDNLVGLWKANTGASVQLLQITAAGKIYSSYVEKSTAFGLENPIKHVVSGKREGVIIRLTDTLDSPGATVLGSGKRIRNFVLVMKGPSQLKGYVWEDRLKPEKIELIKM